MLSSAPISADENKDVVRVIGKYEGSGPLNTVLYGEATPIDIKLFSSGIELNDVTVKFIAEA